MAINSADASKQYLKMRIESSSPIGLVVILYDGAIKYLNRAMEEHALKHHMGFVDHVVKAQNILRELRDSLDMNVDDIAPQLRALYSYMLKRLIVSTVEKEFAPAEEVLKMLESLRNTWDKVRVMAETGQIEVLQKEPVQIRQEAPRSNFPDSPPGDGISIRG